ncbi:hypothetical protein O181_008222 [Austropuccinia psidii MF-1]|uniref:Uncharacterized protein n=1 Tax=Austropuccinia psidii MF-1 TaxID=1389203 RepID=A0A9Q3GJ77_9BASI|nr:hypothetical protein [Austropuccinia psidii MF-1]
MEVLIQLHCHYTRAYCMEENYIPLETQSQANTPVTPSEPESRKGKGKRHSEGLITAKRWTPIATKRNRKPQNSASIQGKPTSTTCTGKTTIINPVLTSKVICHLYTSETLASKGTNQRTEKACPEPEYLEEDILETVVDGKTLREIIPTLPFTFQFNRNLKPGDWKIWIKFLSSIPLGRTWSKLPEDLSRRDGLQRPYDNHQRRTAHTDRENSDSFRLTRSRPNQLSSGFTPFRNQQISVQESPFFTIPGSFQEKTRIQGKKQEHLEPEEERVRPNDPEGVGFGERSAQEPEVVLNNYRISSLINRNITPTQIEHNIVTPESSLNSDSLWLQMPQFAEQSHKQFAELEASHDRMKILTASMDKIVKNLQEGRAKLSKASEETNKRLNLVFEEQHHRKRDRDFLYKDINKLLNVYNSMEPQPQGHVKDNPYHQDDITPDAMLMNKDRSPSKYQDGDHMFFRKGSLETAS